MKKRRIVIVAFMLIAALMLSIGYAVMTATLKITGSASIGDEAAEEAFNEDIIISDVAENSNLETSTIAADGKSAEFAVKDGVLKGQGDKVVIYYTIENTGDIDATAVATAAVSGADPQYFSVTTDWADATQTINAGNTLALMVTVTCVETPVLAEGKSVSASFTVDITATSASS